MAISLSKTANAILEAEVASGRFDTPEAAIEAGLALLAERQRQYVALRESIQTAIAEGGSFTDDEVAAAIEDELDDWEREQAAKPRAAE